jgi:hypothetical protein
MEVDEDVDEEVGRKEVDEVKEEEEVEEEGGREVDDEKGKE